MAWSGLILDLDDTLIDSEKAYARSLSKVGIDPLGKGYAAAKKAVKARLPAGHVSSHNRFLYFKHLLEQEKRYSPKALLKLSTAYEAALSEEVALQWKSLQRASLFEALHKKYRIAILTNETARSQVIKQNAIDPDSNYFPLLIPSEELGTEKPATENFLYAAQLLELPIQKCIAIGNNFQTDVLPAVTLGARGIVSVEFSNGNPPSIPRNIECIQLLNSLREIL